MNFSDALILCRGGARVTRAAWGREGQYVTYQKGYPDGVAINANTAEATGLPEGTVCAFEPYLMFRSEPEGTFTPWLPSMRAILADDWQVVA